MRVCDWEGYLLPGGVLPGLPVRSVDVRCVALVDVRFVALVDMRAVALVDVRFAGTGAPPCLVLMVLFSRATLDAVLR